MSGKLKEVKNRIASVTSTKQITRAMKLVAASKFKRATDAIVQMRPYADKLGEMLSNIVKATEGEISLKLAEEREKVDKVLIVVITSDKGLCGGFNSNVIKQARAALNDHQAQWDAGNVSIMAVGKKGADFFKRYSNINFISDYTELFSDLNFEASREASEYILDSYETGAFDKVVVCYAKFKNAVVQDFQKLNFLPIPKVTGQANPEEELEEDKGRVDYIFEPDKHVLVNELAPKILKTQFYSYLLDSNASEHGARMTAMDSATENANELLNDLKIAYNKARQAAITTELTEIVSGAAALDSGN